MSLVESLTSNPETAIVFAGTMSSCVRHAAIFIKLINRLCGHQRNSIKVDNPEQVNFDPKKLLRQAAGIFTRLTLYTDFIVAVSKEMVL